MNKVIEITREGWIMSTFPEWGTWLNEEIEREVVAPGNVAMWWLGCTGLWVKTPEICNITIDLWCGNGKRTHGDGTMKPGHQMANMCEARTMQPNLRAVPFVIDPFAIKHVDAVLATHYHQDHMSAEYAAHVIQSDMKTKDKDGKEVVVPFIGPEKSVELWQKWGVPKERCITVKPGDIIKLKDIEIIAIDSFDRTCLVTTDSQGADREELTGICPADMDEKAVNYLIKTPGGNIYHSGDSHYSIYFAKHGKDYDIDAAFGSYGENPVGMADKMTSCDILRMAGAIKAIVGYLILTVGSGGLVSNFRPVLVGLKDRFNLNAMVIDPYFGQNAVTAGVEEVFGKGFGQAMILLLIAFIVNIIMVRFSKYTKMRALFTTGHVQVQQAATAYWLIMFACPFLLHNNIQLLIVMAILLGLYWAVGSNLTIKPCQEMTDGAGFCLAHLQMFGVAINYWLAGKLFGKKKDGKNVKKLEDFELPGFMSIFNENMVCTSILMLLFFGVILVILGRDYLMEQSFMTEGESMVFYVIKTCLNFSVYLAILQLGVRTFVTELTQSFQGIADKLLPGSIPGVDCAVVFGFGSANAVPLGFLAGFAGQIIAIAALIVLKSPVLVICGFVPVFFDNATIGIFANRKGGIKAALILPVLSGLCQVFGSAIIAGWIGMASYGGYLGMWDWAVVWPVMTGVMKYLSYAGIIICALAFAVIPQIQYKLDKEGYFLITEDYEAYKEKKAVE